jgi:hypothetical protein
MDAILSLINDNLCQEDPPKKFQQYNPELAARYNNTNGMRQTPPGGGASRAWPAGQPQTMSEQHASANEWSRTPPQQQGPHGAQSRGAPQNNGGAAYNSRPSGQNGQPRFSQDEMNFREAQGSGRQQPQQNFGNRQPGAKAKPKPKAKAQGRRGDEDTVIGKGFTAAMKRGVAQAKPTPMHEEMVPQKDGGFIATIQKGFEGLFGKPTSKEEVLRKRGAVYANEYEAVPGDEIDQRVQFFARRLPEDVAGCLKIYRKTKGEYQINDEIVNMETRYRQNPQGQTDREIFVFWTTEEGEQSDVEPLGLYLSHAANVAYEVKQGGNVITQVPEHIRMSFHEEKGTKLSSGSAEERFNAMEVAARQAEMREKAAMAWREKQNNPADDEKVEGSSMLDDAIAFLNPGAAPKQPPAAPPAAAPPLPPAAPPAAAPMGQGPPPLMVPQAGAQAGTFYGASQYGGTQAGTFYGASQTPFGAQMPRQGTMYATGQMAPAAGYPGMAPIQRQGTMYAYGSAYAVPVR